MTRNNLDVVLRALVVVAMVLGLVGALGTPAVQAVGGSYTLKWYAADPTPNKGNYAPTYAKIPPAGMSCPAPSGGTGRAADPLVDAVAYSPLPSPKLDAVTSLEPSQMVLGQIVPFELEVEVTGITTPENGVISVTVDFATHTTSGDNFGFDPAYMVYCAFVDTADGGAIDTGTNAKVDLWTSTLISGGTTNEKIQGTLQLSGLDQGDRIIVEIWVVLKGAVPAKASGNVATSIVSARTATGDAISVGTQNVPLSQVGSFFSADVDVAIDKTDDQLWKYINEPFTYTLTIQNLNTLNTANGVVATDVLDPWTQFISDTLHPVTIDPLSTRTFSFAPVSGQTGGGTLTFNLGGLTQAGTAGSSVTVTFWVQAIPGVFLGSLIETGTCTHASSPSSPPMQGTQPVDVCNTVSVTTLSNDTNSSNNSDSEPKDIKSATYIYLASFSATGSDGAVQLDWKTATEIFNAGFNLYRAPSPNGHKTKLNGDLIPAVPGSLFGASYSFTDVTVPGKGVYYYWLEDVDILGYATLHGPVKAKVIR